MTTTNPATNNTATEGTAADGTRRRISAAQWAIGHISIWREVIRDDLAAGGTGY